MTDRDFWLVIYRALKMVLTAIEKYKINKTAVMEIYEYQDDGDNVTVAK